MARHRPLDYAVQSRVETGHIGNGFGIAIGLTPGDGTRLGQTTSLFNANARACAGPLIPKIQFNGIGGLPTYISLTPNADVSGLRFFWRSVHRTAAASDVHRTAPKRQGRGCNC